MNIEQGISQVNEKKKLSAVNTDGNGSCDLEEDQSRNKIIHSSSDINI